jgi:hypothetical protein
MKSATKSRYTQVLVWLIWIIVLLVFTRSPESKPDAPTCEPPVLAGIVIHRRQDGPLFPWQRRLRVRIRRRYRLLRRTCHRAVWAARLAKLALRGALTMAAIVDLLTQAQLRRYMGALPILYGLLEVLEVRRIINCMFRPMPTIDSDGCRPLVPGHADHPFQRHVDHFSELIGIGGRHRSDSVDDMIRNPGSRN